MELWDAYDRQRQLTGRFMKRGERRKPDDYHLIIHACLINGKGQMLIQQRTDSKDCYPGLWDITVGGSVVAGENSSQALRRELSEELGIVLPEREYVPQLSVNDGCGFDDIFVLRHEADIASLKLQKEEVQQAKWATKEEILCMIKSGEFIDYMPEYIDLFFSLPDRHGDKIS